jgi:hypothetical protein
MAEVKTPYAATEKNSLAHNTVEGSEVIKARTHLSPKLFKRGKGTNDGHQQNLEEPRQFGVKPCTDNCWLLKGMFR